MTAAAAAIIPARYGSSRFPGKPLAPILGKSLIQRTYEQVQRSPLLKSIIVATDDQRILEHVESFGGRAIMTPVGCVTGTDRLACTLKLLPELETYDYIFNIQGDEPLIDPAILQGLFEKLQLDPEAVMATPITPIKTSEEACNGSIVKCVRALNGRALYFSRALIPCGHTPQELKHPPYYRHLGVYAYRRKFLQLYTELPPTPLQLAEDLEQLKVLEHGYAISTLVVETPSVGVDHPEDIQRLEEILCAQNISLSLAESARL